MPKQEQLHFDDERMSPSKNEEKDHSGGSSSKKKKRMLPHQYVSKYNLYFGNQ